MLYLYVKTHRQTGLKYLGYTSQDPHSYHGSGVYWKLHLKKHGYDYDTEILHECQDKDEVRRLGLHYTALWNIVESEDWANLKEECGDGGRQSAAVRQRMSEATRGRTPWNKGKHVWTEEQRAMISQRNRDRGPQTAEHIAKRVAKNTGKTRSDDTKAQLSEALKGRTFTEETKHKMSESAKQRGFNGYGFEKGQVPHNAQSVQIQNIATGEITTAPSLKEWCREHDVSHGGAWKAFKEGREFKQYRKVDVEC
jgi:hypothetical protein